MGALASVPLRAVVLCSGERENEAVRVIAMSLEIPYSHFCNNEKALNATLLFLYYKIPECRPPRVRACERASDPTCLTQAGLRANETRHACRRPARPPLDAGCKAALAIILSRRALPPRRQCPLAVTNDASRAASAPSRARRNTSLSTRLSCIGYNYS